MISGLLIDPFELSTSRVELSEDSTLADAKKFMQLEGPIDIVTLSDNTMVIVDDEALLKNDQRYFKLTEFHQPLAGRAIIVGYDDEGETINGSYNADTIEWMPEDHIEEPFMQFIPMPDDKEVH